MGCQMVYIGMAKMICTLVFISQLEPEIIMKEDIYDPLSDFLYTLSGVCDSAGFAAGKKMRYVPDTCRSCPSGTSNITAGNIRRLSGDDAGYLAFPYVEFFHPVGMHSAIPGTDLIIPKEQHYDQT